MSSTTAIQLTSISAGALPSKLTFVGNSLYFGVDYGNSSELWKSDGTVTGTEAIKAFLPPLEFSGIPTTEEADVEDLIDVNGTLYVLAEFGEALPDDSYFELRRGLWTSNGTPEGTSYFESVFAPVFSLSDLYNFNGTLVFQEAGDSTGARFYKTDGTAEGTVLIKDFYPHQDGPGPANLTTVGNTLFFSIDTNIYGDDDGRPNIGDELWKSNLTTAGTIPVKDINPGVPSSSPSYLTSIGNTLYFSANDGTNGRELWKSDGTAAGTVLIKNINSGSNSSDPTSLTNVNGTLFFAANNGTNGNELWKSNGTNAGTVLVKDINPGSGSSDIANLINVNGTLFFTASTDSGSALWRSDGTAAGTILLKQGVGNGSFVNADGTLYFTAYDSASGQELWKSNGTVAGTVLAADINPGPIGSNPTDLTYKDGNLYFVAYDETEGPEVYVLDVDGGTTPPPPAGSTAVAPAPINLRPNAPRRLKTGDGNGNTLEGLARHNTILARGGDDKLYGNVGYDRLFGEAGNDTAYGRAGNDLLDGGGNNDTLYGEGGDDYLNGRSGSDRLIGGIGHDVLIGGDGDDTLTGGGGKDVFTYNALPDDRDTITDFSVSEDLIDLRNILNQSAFTGATSFAKFTQYVQLLQSGTSTQVRVDQDGSGSGTTFITLAVLQNTPASNVTSLNFVI